MTHAAPQPPRVGRDRCPLDEQTGDLAEVIETALADIGGDSPLYRAMSEHAARAVQLWIDFQLQRGTLRVIVRTESVASPSPRPSPTPHAPVG